MSALHLAIQEQNDSQIEWLLEHGAEAVLHLRDAEGNTPLMLAVRHHIYDWYLQKLLERGSDLQAQNKHGLTALMLALDDNNLNAVQTLLVWHTQKGEPAQVEASLEEGRLALFFAVYTNDSSTVAALLETGTDVNVQNAWERTPLMLASELGHEAVLRCLLEHGAVVALTDEEGYTALSLAAREGHTSCVRLLLQYGAAPNTHGNLGYTPLMDAVFSSDTPEIVRLLLEQGAQVHARSENGSTALSLASWMRREESVRVLLAWGAAEDKEALQSAYRSAFLDNGQNTAPLLEAAGVTIGLLEAIARRDVSGVYQQVMVQKADVNARLPNGRTPLMVAVYSACLGFYGEAGIEIVRLLLEQGADVNARTHKGTTALLDAAYFRDVKIEKLLMAYGADVNARGESVSEHEDETPLTLSPFAENLEALQEMVGRGADVNTQNQQDRSALMWAAQFGGRDVVELLLRSGASVHLRDIQGRTALMYAASGGEPEIIALLLTYGAEADVVDIAGITALQLAQGWVGKGVVELLEQAGAKE